jgi:uncharacterized membrane protein YphA (DoxX/SURF4 family)
MMTVSTSPSLLRRIDATGIPLLLARLGVGGMFAYLAYMKLRDPINFLKLTREYGILSPDQPLFLNLTAVALPWLEMICAAALLLGLGRRGAALLVAGMLLFFTPMLFLRAWGMHTAVGSAFPTLCAVKFDCGCGTGPQFICPKLAENVALLIGALIALFSTSRRFCLENLFVRRRAAPAALPVPEHA